MNRTLNQLRQPKSTPSLRSTALLLSLVTFLNSQITACAGDKFEPAQPKIEGFSGGGGKAGSETAGNGGQAGAETAGSAGKAGSKTAGNGGNAGSETSGNGGQAGTENSGNGGMAGSETAGNGGNAGSKTSGNGGQAGTENSGNGGMAGSETAGNGGQAGTETSGNGGEAGSETAGSAGSTPETCTDPKIGKICAEGKGVCSQTKYVWTCKNDVYKCQPETPLSELEGYSTKEICGDNLDNNCDGKGDLQNEECEKPTSIVILSTIKTSLYLADSTGNTSSQIKDSPILSQDLTNFTFPSTFVASGNNGLEIRFNDTCAKFGTLWKSDPPIKLCGDTFNPEFFQQPYCLNKILEDFKTCKTVSLGKCQSKTGLTYTQLPQNSCSQPGTPSILVGELN